MKRENLRKFNTEEIEKKLAELRENLRALHFKAEGAKPKNVKEARSRRKEIARVLTFINEQKTNGKQG